ncbi:ABC transporter ATP-binding protein [uncultured Anaerococcus sp.]|uniref:ABC transporter ATP-binding protein n=1 Tax=uncultured Anaerococcus sp. TaxID=293428 RepID=UPI00288C33AE|nr:ABC transporter ATP-binding protein [uncultured Anaerococcus sp.]
MKAILNFLGIRKKRLAYFGLFILALVSNLLLISAPLIQKSLVNNLLSGSILKTDIFKFLLVSFSIVIISFIQIYMLNRIKILVQKSISLDLLDSLTIEESTIISARGPSAFLSSIFGDAEQISTRLLADNMFFGIISIISSIVILFISYRWMKIFPLLILISYVLAGLGLFILQKRRSVNFKILRDEIMKLNPIMLETIENKNALMNNGNFNERRNLIEEKMDERDESFKKVLVYEEMSRGFIDTIKHIALIAFFILAMFEINKNNLQISSFIALNFYFETIFMPLYFARAFYDTKTSLNMFYERNKTSYEAKSKLNIPKTIDYKIENLGLRYDDRVLLDGLSIKLDKVYGIVGLSGEGKSSLFNLLLGNEKASQGIVLVGDKNISELDLNMRLALFRYYPQENEIFDDDLDYNITLGKKRLRESEYRKKEKEINDSLLKIRQGDFDENYKLILNTLTSSKNHDSDDELRSQLVNNLSKMDQKGISDLACLILSHNFYIGQDYDILIEKLNLSHLKGRKLGQRGNKISGGEKERIALARLLLVKTRAAYLIDEPFNSLDLISEKEASGILKSYLENEKGLIISHKIDLLNKLTDEIIVINKGKIEAIGKHEKLLKDSEVYKKLYEEYLKKFEKEYR